MHPMAVALPPGEGQHEPEFSGLGDVPSNGMIGVSQHRRTIPEAGAVVSEVAHRIKQIGRPLRIVPMNALEPSDRLWPGIGICCK